MSQKFQSQNNQAPQQNINGFEGVIKALQDYVDTTVKSQINEITKNLPPQHTPVPLTSEFKTLSTLVNTNQNKNSTVYNQKLKPFLSYHNEGYQGEQVFMENAPFIQKINKMSLNNNSQTKNDNELPYLQQILKTAENKKRHASTKTDRQNKSIINNSNVSNQQTHINLNINNYKISFRQLGKYVVQQDNQFKRGPQNYSQKIIDEIKQPNLRTIGRQLEELDASRSLLQNIEKLSVSDKAQIRVTTSDYYDGKTGKPMRMSDLADLNLNDTSNHHYSRNPQQHQSLIGRHQTERNPDYSNTPLKQFYQESILHEDYKSTKPGERTQRLNKTVDKYHSVYDNKDEAMFTRNYIKSAYDNMVHIKYEKRAVTSDGQQLLKDSYNQYNQENYDTIKNYYLPQVRELEDMGYIEKQRAEQEKSKNMTLLNNIMREIYHDENKRDKQQEGLKFEQNFQNIDNCIMKLEAEKLIPYHPFFKKLSLLAVKELMLYCMLIRVRHGQTLYKEGDHANNTAYIVLYGKFLLHTSKHGAIGQVTTGDSLGEEGIFEKKDLDLPVFRQEIATAEEDCFILELNSNAVEKVKEQLYKSKLQMDWFTINNTLKRAWVQKKSWRQFKIQENSANSVLL